MNTISYYIKKRDFYFPNNLNIIFLLESPPVSGKYFYEKNGDVTEPLFKAFMKALKIQASSKEEGLCEFCNRGYLLVDATYTPVNKMTNAQRNRMIFNNYDNLVKDLSGLINNRNVRIILIKANIFKILKNKLITERFNVINGDIMIPFPSNGWQNKFHERLHLVLNKLD